MEVCLMIWKIEICNLQNGNMLMIWKIEICKLQLLTVWCTTIRSKSQSDMTINDFVRN